MSTGDYIVSWLQTINIVIFFILSIFLPIWGPLAWFFGGFFMLLVQAPLFLVLLVFQLKSAWTHWRQKTLLTNKLLFIPWVIIPIVVAALTVIEQRHLNDPFYNDAYEVRVELFPDGSCEVRFEDQEVASRKTHRYDWFGSKVGDISCRDEAGESHAMVQFESAVGTYPIYDTQGGFARNGGAYFDDVKGNRLSPSALASVYWDFVGGEVEVLKIEPSDSFDKPLYLRSPKLSVVLQATAKRRFRGF